MPQGKKAVVELARSLSIQIDNLCQFLPQDKVVEFAAMTPVELLRQTQRAVAPQEMIDMHDDLKDLRRKQKGAQAKLTADQDTLANLEGRQRLQEADVERMREREQIEKHVTMLEAGRPFAAYRAARALHGESKNKRKEAQEELTKLENEVEPLLRAVNTKERYMEQIQTVVSERKTAIGKAERQADTVDRKFQDLQDKNNDLVAAYEAEKNGAKKHRSEVARQEQAIARLRKQLEEQPSEVDVQSYNELIREKRRAIEDCNRQGRDLQDKQQQLTQRGQEKNSRIKQGERHLAELDSQAGKQNVKLQKASRDTSRLWEWVREHQSEFERPVFGPPIVACSVKDPKYVDHIEALFQRNLFLTFTVQTKDDFKKLSDQAHERMHLSEVNIRTIQVGLEPFQPAVGVDEMNRFGFEGWAISYLNGPEPVLAMLCAEIHLHHTGVALRDTTPHQFDMLQNSPIGSWVTSKSSYRINRRREYGPGATSTQVKELRRANIWTDQPVDITAKRELQENIQGWGEEVAAFKAESEEAQRNLLALREAIHKHQEEDVRPVLSVNKER